MTCIDVSVAADNVNEHVCVTAKRGTLSFTVISAYIQPAARFDADRLIAKAMCAPKQCVVCGDFNGHHELWGNVKVTVADELPLKLRSNSI